ncbi:MAG: AI-2E family transporter, partial [Desulfitobacterium sp.]|nr:AI-2E family transporter [Desulfitobacterium sp.]
MNLQGDPKLRQNINRLVVITFTLVLLKVVTVFFQEFLPVFSEVVSQLFAAFLPFIIAIFIALLLEPLVSRFIKSLKVHRAIATLLALIIVILGIGGILFLIIARLYTELAELSVSLPSSEYFLAIFGSLIHAAENFIQLNPQIQIALTDATEGLVSNVQSWAIAGSKILLNFISALPGVFVVLVMSIVASFFMSASYPEVKSF